MARQSRWSASEELLREMDRRGTYPGDDCREVRFPSLLPSSHLPKNFRPLVLSLGDQFARWTGKPYTKNA